MGSKFIPNMPRSTGKHALAKARTDGFKMGILAGAVVLNDVFDMSDDDIKEWINQSNVLVGSIANRTDNARYLLRELEKMTGIEIVFEED